MNVKEPKKEKSIRTLKRESKAARRESLRPLCYPLKVDDTWINKPAQALLKQKLNGIFYVVRESLLKTTECIFSCNPHGGV